MYESTTLSRLFSSYCMNVYGSSLWRYNNLRNIERFCISYIFLCMSQPHYLDYLAHIV